MQAYLPLDPQQQREFEQLMTTETYRGVQAVNKTYYESGLEKGREEGLRAALCELLEAKFGPLTPQVQERLQQLTADRLAGLPKAVYQAQSLRELGLED